jgi:hypothetical protein
MLHDLYNIACDDSSEYIGSLENPPAHAIAAVNTLRGKLTLPLVEKVVDGLDTLLSPDLRWKVRYMHYLLLDSCLMILHMNLLGANNRIQQER